MVITPRARSGPFCGVCGRPAAGNGPHALCDVCSAGAESPGVRQHDRDRVTSQNTKEKAVCRHYTLFRNMKESVDGGENGDKEQ